MYFGGGFRVVSLEEEKTISKTVTVMKNKDICPPTGWIRHLQLC